MRSLLRKSTTTLPVRLSGRAVYACGLHLWNLYLREGSLYPLITTQAVRDRAQLPSFRMCFRFEIFMRILFLLLAICCSSVFAQQLPPAPKAHVIDVTPNAGYFNEPAIAVNPKDPKQAVVAWQVPASAAYSHDG